jgi:hypothetical protein
MVLFSFNVVYGYFLGGTEEKHGSVSRLWMREGGVMATRYLPLFLDF